MIAITLTRELPGLVARAGGVKRREIGSFDHVWVQSRYMRARTIVAGGEQVADLARLSTAGLWYLEDALCTQEGDSVAFTDISFEPAGAEA